MSPGLGYNAGFGEPSLITATNLNFHMHLDVCSILQRDDGYCHM